MKHLLYKVETTQEIYFTKIHILSIIHCTGKNESQNVIEIIVIINHN